MIAGAAARRPAPSLSAVEVSVALLGGGGGPGDVRHRAEYRSRSAAVGFALTTAYGLDAERVAVTLVERARDEDDRTLVLVGSAGEIACTLALDPGYRGGVRRTRLAASPAVVRIVTDTVAAGTGSGQWWLHVRSVFPEPIPAARIVSGPYGRVDALRFAETIAQRLGGALRTCPERCTITVTHPATVGELDRTAARRYDRITAADAALSTLEAGTEQLRALHRERADLVAELAHHTPPHLARLPFPFPTEKGPRR